MSNNDGASITVSAITSLGLLSPGEHSVMIDGLEQRHHVASEGPVCIVHSGGPGVNWEYLRTPEVERHLALVYMEPIGTGNSGRLADPRGYTLDRYARQIDELMPQLQLETAYLLGHSHGGFVAQWYALEYPARLSGLILYDTSPATTEEFGVDMREQLARVAERHTGEPWVADTMAAWEEIFHASADPAMSDEDLTRIFHRMLPAYFADYTGVSEQVASLGEAMRIYGAPGQGEEDPAVRRAKPFLIHHRAYTDHRGSV